MSGQPCDRLLRNAVNALNGNYRTADTPLFIAGPHGRAAERLIAGGTLVDGEPVRRAALNPAPSPNALGPIEHGRDGTIISVH